MRYIKFIIAFSLISLVPMSSNGEKKQGEIHTIGGIEFVWIPEGCFLMGSNDGFKDEKPVHKVCLDGFWMGKYEVTQKQYEIIMGTNPSEFQNKPNNPVEQVSWNDAIDFAEKFSSKNDVKVTLPTEAQWEYAARAGTSTEYYWGNSKDFSIVDQYAVYSHNSILKGEGNSDYGTHRVGSKKPNAMGLYDMSGNVWEWCLDWFNENYYSQSSEKNPIGALNGSSTVSSNGISTVSRVNRGGCWLHYEESLRSANRGFNMPDVRYKFYGFRLVVNGK